MVGRYFRAAPFTGGTEETMIYLIVTKELRVQLGLHYADFARHCCLTISYRQ